MSYVYQPSRIELERQIRRHAGSLGGRILDVGAGKFDRYSGFFTHTEYLRMDVPGTPGIDVEGTAESIPFPDESFDSVVSTQVLGDVFDVAKAVGEFYRVLRSGGAVLITEALFDTLHDEPHDYWRFTPHALRKLFEDAGFVVETLEQRGGYFSVMAQLRIRYAIERHDIYRRWYRRWFSAYAQLCTRYALMRDRKDQSKANRVYAHGWLLVARKP